MGLVIPIGIAKALFHWLTFWGAFKALKVPKTKTKIPRMAFKRNDPLTIPRTPPTLKTFTKAQKERRTQIKAMTQVCLVWVIWTRLKLLIDWVAWAIPFYDEIHLLILIWMIVMGPRSAEFLFDHCIKRLASPHEESFDAILGTMHDFLVIIMYLITSGPNYLVREFGKWKARQFNKSLLSARAVAPPSRLPSRKSSHFHTKPNPSGSAPTNSHLEPSTRSEKTSLQPNVSLPNARTRYPSLGPTPWETSRPVPTVKPPQRKPTLSRKLSSSYKRSVSNSSLRSVLEHRSSYNLPKKNEVRTLENRLKSKPPLATAHLNTLKEPKPMIFGNTKVKLPAIQAIVTKKDFIDQNQQPFVNENSDTLSNVISTPVIPSQQDEENLKAFFHENSTELSKVCELSEDQIGNNSLIVHENISEPVDPTVGLPWSAISDCVPPQSRKRAQRPDDDDFFETFSNPLETRREGSVQIVSPPSVESRSSIGMPSSPAPDHNLLEAPPTKRQKVLSPPSDASSGSSDVEAASDQSMASDSSSSNQSSAQVHQDETMKCDLSTWFSAPNAAIPMPDQTLSPTKAPAPNVKRRLHNPDEPLPKYEQSLETVLYGLRDLDSDLTLPSSNRVTKSSYLSPRISGYFQNKLDSNPSSKTQKGENSIYPKKRSPQVKKIIQTINSKSDQKRRVSSLSKKPISGKLGEEKATQARLKQQALNQARTERQNHEQFHTETQILKNSSKIINPHSTQ